MISPGPARAEPLDDLAGRAVGGRPVALSGPQAHSFRVASGGGRGAQAPVVASGDYLVTLTVGGKTYKQLLRVERVSGGDDTSAFGFDEDEPHDP